MKRRLITSVLLRAAAVGVAAYLSTMRVDRGRSPAARATKEDTRAAGRQRPFTLTDSRGSPVTDQFFRGDWLVVFFGFTHCVDVCPTALHKLSAALQALGDSGSQVRVAFITVDPERDTPEVLHAYLQTFGPSFIGLTGTPEQIHVVEQTFRVYAEKQPATVEGNYAINHSGSFYVLDPNGQFCRQISADTDIKDLASTLRRAMNLHAS